MKVVPLGDVATVERRGVDPSTLAPETPYLGLEHIERGGRIIGRDSVGGAKVLSTKFTFDQCHVLFGKLRPNLGKVSRPTFAGVCSTDILPIRPGPDLDAGYLAHYLAQPGMVAFAASRVAGANLPRLSPSVLLTFPVPLLPMPEQQRIAAILDRSDALRAQRRTVLDRLNSLTRSIFLDMFGGDEAGGTVEELAADRKGSIRTGPFGSQLLHSEFVDEGIAVLGLDNVVSGEFRWAERRFVSHEKYEQLKRYTVHPGDVLVSIMGTTGRCVVVPDGIPTAINTKHICAISVNPECAFPEFVRAAFLWHPVSFRYLRRQTKGAIMDGLNMGIVKKTPLPLPDLARQGKFVERVRTIREQADAAQRALALQDELFSSLQSRGFRGEL